MGTSTLRIGSRFGYHVFTNKLIFCRPVNIRIIENENEIQNIVYRTMASGRNHFITKGSKKVMQKYNIYQLKIRMYKYSIPNHIFFFTFQEWNHRGSA